MTSLYDIQIRQNWYCPEKKHGSFKETKYFHLYYYSFLMVPKKQTTNFWV
jgi:hypothetical protein